MKVRVEISELVWQDVGVRDYIEGLLAKPLLHLDDVGTETILAGELERVREMVYLLVIA